MEKSYTKETLGIFWKSALRYKWLCAGTIVSVMVSALLGVISPIYLKKFFDVISSAPGNAGIDAIFGIVFMIAVLKGLEWLFMNISNFFDVKFKVRVTADLSTKCFRYVHKHSFSFFNNNFVGSLVKRVRSFSHAFETVADSMIWDLAPLVVSVAFILFVLFRMSPLLGWGIVGWIVAYCFISVWFSRFKLKYDIKRNAAETAESSLLADTFTNNANVKLMNGYKREVGRFMDAILKVSSFRTISWNLSNIFEAIQGIFITGLEIGMLVIAVNLWSKGQLTVGDFVLIQSYLLQMFMRVLGFGRVIRRFYESLSDAGDMTEILVEPHEVVDKEGAKDIIVDKGNIIFDDVSFSYKDGNRIISGLNINIHPGEKIAFIGPSGAGKSTIVKLLMRMHDLPEGKITIDGQNISEVTEESLWHSMSLVPQDPVLFHRSLMENIRYGRPEATDEEVIEAANAAHCHEFISGFKEGYDTYVGERGVKLSGGERQRVAIARAILRNAPILVLDEATSSLDSESEVLIQDALESLMKNKTVIVIAHRLSTIRKMDRIVAIENGMISEEGSHEELSKKEGGMYRRLWELQAGGFSGEK